MPREEVMVTRRQKIGVRKQRMGEFDAYVQAVADSAEGAAIFSDLDEDPKKFVISLRSAFKRNGVDAVVRKMRDKDEVRAWLPDSSEASASEEDFDPDEELDEEEDEELDEEEEDDED
jgi:hypothetical protein